MISEIFQDIFNKLTKNLARVVGITDKKFKVVASSDISQIGKKLNVELSFEKINSYAGINNNGYSCHLLGNKQFGSWCVFCEGEDQESKNYVNILSITIDETIKFYASKYDKCTFIRDVILNNILPSDIIIRQRELNFEDDSNKVCIIIKNIKNQDNNLFENAKNLFCDNDKDFVVNISEFDIVIIKSVNESTTDAILHKLATSIVNSLSNDKFMKCVASIGPVVKQISELNYSFRGAQMALEVRKVFETNSNVVLYNQLGLPRLIYQLPENMCKSFLNEIFKKGPIDLLDKELMFTINKFFENSLNVSETSRKLFVHRNTLVYRVEKIKKITGLDLRDFEDAIVFKIALMVNKYLKEKPIKY